MLTVTQDPRTRFIVAGACWSAALLAVLKSPQGERALIVPFTSWQAGLAARVAGGSPVTIDLSCSGSDIIALSIAAILAYPVPWRRRLPAAALAILWVAALNSIRLATLVKTAGSPLFYPLHVYVWPGILIAGAVTYVWIWIWLNETDRRGAGPELTRNRLAILVGAPLIVAYAALLPSLLASATLERGAIAAADTAAALLRACGVSAVTGGSTLVVATRAFLITPECIVTPLMPLYLAAAIVYPHRRRTRLIALALFVPLFASLGVARLLTVALPTVLGSSLYVTHGFYQFAAGVLLIAAAARLRSPDGQLRDLARRAGIAIAAAVGVAVLLAAPYTEAIESGRAAIRSVAPHAWSTMPQVADSQGALRIMPAYELSLLCGLVMAWHPRPVWRALIMLVPAGAVLQIATLVIGGELAARFEASIPVVLVRTASILTPAVLFLLVVRRRTAA